MKLWDVATGSTIRNFSGHTAAIRGVAFASDSRYVLSGGSDQTINMWDVTSGGLIRTFTGHTVSIISIAASPDGGFIAHGSTDGSIKLWDVANGREVHIFKGHSGWVYNVAFSPDGKYLLSGGSDNTIRLWELSSGSEIQVFNGHSSGVSSVALSNDGKHLVSGGKLDKTIKLWDVTSGLEIRNFTGHSKSVESLKFSPYGEYLLSASQDKTVKLWDIVSGKELRTFNGHTKWVFDAEFSPDGKQILSGSGDNTMKLWDVASGQELQTYSGHASYVNSVAFSPDGKYAASGSMDNTLKLWEVSTGKEQHTFHGHTNSVTSIAFSSEGRFVYSGSLDGTIRIWDIPNQKELLTIVSFKNSEDWLSVTPDWYFFGSRSSLKNIHYVDGLKVYSFDQFDLQYNRPDIILERLGKASPETINAYRAAWEKRILKMGFKASSFSKENSFNFPELSITSKIGFFEERNTPNYSFSIAANDKLFKLERLLVNVNGVPVYGMRGKDLKSLKSKTLRQDLDVKLSTGINKITVSVLNEKGVESFAERFQVTYTPLNPKKPNLHVIAIGVSKFQQSDFNLTYADKDASDLTVALKQLSGLYDKIKIHTLTNEKATKDNILSLRLELEQTNEDDEVIVFAATHGLLDDDLDYYLAMHNTDFANPGSGGLRYDELENLIDGIPARNKLMLLDACHSGEVDKEETEVTASNRTDDGSVKSRGFRQVKTKSGGIGLKSSFELMKELFADLRRNNAVVISSASGQEFAFESPEWQNGVFSYSLLDGLQSGHADLDKNGTIIVSELRDYVSRRVRELTDGKQNPTSRTENLENDFRVW